MEGALKDICRIAVKSEWIAPQHWNRAEHLTKNDLNVIKDAASYAQDFNMNLENMSQLPQLLLRTAKTLGRLVQSIKSRVYMVDQLTMSINYVPAEMENMDSEQRSWKLELSRTIVAHVALQQESVLVNNVYADFRFPEHTGWPEHDISSVLCVPVTGQNEVCCAVLEFARTDEHFEQRDLDVVTIVCGWLGSSLDQLQRRVFTVEMEHILSQIQLSMRQYMAAERHFDDVVDEVLRLLKHAIRAEHISMFVISARDDNLSCRVYKEARIAEPARFIPESFTYPLSGKPLWVYQNLQSVTVADASKDPHYNPKNDRRHNIHAKSLFYAPIKTRPDRCDAVIKAVNKLPKGQFTEEDVKQFEVMFERSLSAIMGYQLQTELLTVSKAENSIRSDFLLNRLQIKYISQPVALDAGFQLRDIPDFLSFNWYPVQSSKQLLIHMAHLMIMDVCNRELLTAENTLSYVVTTNKMHNPLPLHDFRHSFVCLHTVYCVLKRGGCQFDDLERIALVLAAIARNIEHTGCSNAMLRISKHPLSIAHSNACRQNHQFWLANLLIQNTGVLGRLNDQQQARVLHVFKEQMITASLLWHMRNARYDLEEICTVNAATGQCAMDWSDQRHRALLCGLIGSVSSLNLYCKPYRVSRKACAGYMAEVYAEGDAVRAHGLTPVPHMDREHSRFMAAWQVRMVTLVLPSLQWLRNVLAGTEELYQGAVCLRKSWMEVIDHRGQKVWNPDDSVADEIES